MSVVTGTNAVTSGLVFEHDMTNTSRSWMGMPTTNLLPTPLTISSTWTKEGGFGTVTPNYGYAPDGTQTSTQCVFTGGYLYYPLTLTPGVTYTFSCYVNGNPQAGRGIGLWSYAVGGIVAASNQSINADTWTRVSVTYTVAAGASSFAIMLAGYPSNIFQGTIEVWHPQIEVNSFASPFVDGTRSNTQSLLDATTNNIITSSSLTYANNNTFSFNGSSNFADCGQGSAISAITGTNTVSVEAWVNLTGYGSSGYGVITHKGYPWAWLMENPSNTMRIRFYLSTSGDVFCSDSVTHALNTWYQFVGTYDGSNMRFYRNGILTNTVAGSGTLGGAGASMIIGSYGGAYFSQGQIPVVKIYNKTLSSSDVLQNFNAYRGRYGI